MSSDSARLIEAWFAEHQDDGEFTCHGRAIPYAVIGPANTGGRIIFTTKPAIVSRAIDEGDVREQVGMVGRYGLPSEEDLSWIREVIRQRGVLFLGDMDPVDLMTFAWLRARLHPKAIAHLGVSDGFLGALQLSPAECHSIPCAPSEEKSLPILRKVLPDCAELIGARCAQILNEGRKIELEAVVSAKGAAALLRPAAAGR